MAEELVRLLWCDHCAEDDIKTAVEKDSGALRGLDLGAGPRDLDVAEECQRGMMWLDMVDLYMREGRPVKVGAPPRTSAGGVVAARRAASSVDVGQRHGGPNSAADHPCPWCPSQPPFGSYATARNHIRSSHGLDVEELPARCPICDGVNNATGKPFNGFRGMTLHTHSIHGMSAMRAYLAAKQSGDPHGLWAIADAMAKGSDARAS